MKKRKSARLRDGGVFYNSSTYASAPRVMGSIAVVGTIRSSSVEASFMALAAARRRAV